MFAAIAGLLASCDMSKDFSTYPYTVFGNTGTTVSEQVGSFKIPVCLYNAENKSVSVTIKSVDGTAVSGTDYTITEPASGVLSFAQGDTVKYVTVSIVDNPGVYTGDKEFTLQLVSATENVEIYNSKVCNVVIADEDHPLIKMFGDYTATATFVYYSSSAGGWVGGNISWTATFSAVDGDVTRLAISPFCNSSVDATLAAATVTAQVSEDHNTLTLDVIDPPTSGDLTYPGGEYAYIGANDYYNMYLYACTNLGSNGSGANYVATATMTKNDSGSFVIDDDVMLSFECFAVKDFPDYNLDKDAYDGTWCIYMNFTLTPQ